MVRTARTYAIDFFRLSRPAFLIGGVAMHTLGVVMALYSGASPNWRLLILGQLAITFVQLMTHYSSEYFDLDADRVNQAPTRWSGGSRVLPDGRLPPSVALVTALVCMAAVMIVMVLMVVFDRPGPLPIALIAAALVLAWSYSSPPLRLHSAGLGEIAIALIVTGLTPLLGYSLQAGRLDLLPVLAVLPLCLIQLATQIIVDLPDIEGDTAAAKRTLAVRLGVDRGTRWYSLGLVVAYLLLPLMTLFGLPTLVWLMTLPAAPAALWQIGRMERGAWADRSHRETLIVWAIGLLMGTAGLEGLGFLILILLRFG